MKRLSKYIVLCNFFCWFNCYCQDNGLIKKYYENGAIKSIEKFKNGKLDSTCLTYYKSGKINTICNFKDGLKNGVSYKYDEKGSLIWLFNSVSDSTIFSIQFSNGKLLRSTINKQELYYINDKPYLLQDYLIKKGQKNK